MLSLTRSGQIYLTKIRRKFDEDRHGNIFRDSNAKSIFERDYTDLDTLGDIEFSTTEGEPFDDAEEFLEQVEHKLSFLPDSEHQYISWNLEDTKNSLRRLWEAGYIEEVR